MIRKFLLKLSDNFRTIYKKNDNEAEEKEYIEKAVEKNRSLLLFVSIWAALFQLFNLFRVFFMSNSGISTWNNFLYFCFYLSLLIVCFVYMFMDKGMHMTSINRYRLHMVYATLFLLWQTLFNVYDVARIDSAGNFTLSVTLMAFSAIFIMKPLYFLLNLGALSMLFLLMAGQAVPFGVKYNFVVMILLCLVVYHQRYTHEKRERDQKHEIETAQKAYWEERERFRLTHEQYEIICRSSHLITFKWDVKSGNAYFSEQWSNTLGQPLYISDLESFVRKATRLPDSDKKQILTCLENVKNGVPYQKEEIGVPGNDGRLHWYELRATTQENCEGEPIFGIGILLDIMEQKQEIRKIRHHAEIDFTGILNKSAIEKYGRARIQQLNADETFIMLILDLDNFKRVNDTFGHPVGDIVLSEVASRMKENALPGMRVGRIGGDEFVAIYAGIDTLSPRFVNAFAEKVQECIRTMRLPVGDVNTKASIGIAALSKEEDMTYDELYAKADEALYEAKKAGKGTIRWGGVYETFPQNKAIKTPYDDSEKRLENHTKENIFWKKN